MTATTETTSHSMTNPSTERYPLTQQQWKDMLSSADVEATWKNSAKGDLSLLCASVDSVASAGTVDFWKSKDIGVLFASSESVQLPPLPPVTTSTHPLSSTTHPFAPTTMPLANIDAAMGSSIPHSLVATLMSGDSVFASKDPVFASIDPLPFKSLDLKSLDTVMSFSGIANDSQMPDAAPVPTFYGSGEWLGFYKNTHLEAPYKDVFQASDASTPPPPIKRKSSKWMERYTEMMKQNATPPSAARLQATQEAITTEAPKKKPAPAKKRGEPKQKIYVTPGKKDIISGRGGKSNSWPGNESYRAAIEEAKPAYRDGQKYEKTIMSQEIVEKMMAEGRRFLKLEDSGPHKGEYYLMTKNQARKKAGQALREENTPQSRKKKRDFYTNRKKQNE